MEAASTDPPSALHSHERVDWPLSVSSSRSARSSGSLPEHTRSTIRYSPFSSSSSWLSSVRVTRVIDTGMPPGCP